MGKDYTTIRVEQDAKDTAEQAKRDGETWSDYMRRCTDNPPEVREFVSAKEIAEQSAFESSGSTVGLEATTIKDIATAVAEELRG